nr:hypothetical protein [Tanacetum cinerariifolium]
MPPGNYFAAALNPCFNVIGVELLIESISTDVECFDSGFETKAKERFNKSLEVTSESAFSTSGRVLSIQRARLTPASLEMYFEEEILDEEVLENEAIALSDEEIALDEAGKKDRSNRSGGEEIDMTLFD